MEAAVGRYVAITPTNIGRMFETTTGTSIEYADLNSNSGISPSCEATSSGGSFPNIGFGDCGIYRATGGGYLQNSIEATGDNSATIREGLSLMDVLIGREHILQISEIRDAFSKIAADMTGDGQITTIDLVYIRAAELGLFDDSSPTPIWKYVPICQFVNASTGTRSVQLNHFWADFVDDPFDITTAGEPDYPDYMDYAEMEYERNSGETYDGVAIDFENAMSTIKMGDIDRSYHFQSGLNKAQIFDTTVALVDTTNYDLNAFYDLQEVSSSITTDDIASPDTSEYIDVSFNGTCDSLIGIAFDVEFPSDVTINDVSFNNTTISNLNINEDTSLFHIDGNKVNLLFYTDDTSGVNVNSQDLFSIELEIPTSYSSTIIYTIENFEAYSRSNSETATLDFELRPQPINIQNDDDVIDESGTIIGINSPNEYIYSWKLINQQGQVIESRNLSGQNIKSVDYKQFLRGHSTGIYYIQINTDKRNQETFKIHNLR